MPYGECVCMRVMTFRNLHMNAKLRLLDEHAEFVVMREIIKDK
jgi:hypothetical protein